MKVAVTAEDAGMTYDYQTYERWGQRDTSVSRRPPP